MDTYIIDQQIINLLDSLEDVKNQTPFKDIYSTLNKYCIENSVYKE